MKDEGMKSRPSERGAVTNRAKELRADIGEQHAIAAEQKTYGDAWERRGYIYEACKRWSSASEARRRAAALQRDLDEMEKTNG